MKQAVLWLLVLALGLGVVAIAQESSEEDELREEDVEMLDRNVRLDFKLVPLDKDDNGVFLITASPWYFTSVIYGDEDYTVEFEASGRIMSADDDMLLISYEVLVVYSGEDEEAEFRVEASARCTPGKEMAVASMGDKTLMVRASYVEAAAE